MHTTEFFSLVAQHSFYSCPYTQLREAVKEEHYQAPLMR